MAAESQSLSARPRRTPLRTLTANVLSRVDAWYRRKYRLLPVGSVLLVGVAPYRGATREFPDGTQLLSSDSIGELHFNNARVALLGEGTRQRIGVRFARLFRQSLRELAMQAQTAPQLRNIAVYHGVTWFKPHGHKVGFVSEPVTAGLKRSWQAAYLRLLAWGFAPMSAERKLEFEPRQFWITRSELIKHFGTEANDTDE